MSLSPSAAAPGGLADYETGWVALHRMLREGRSLSGRERHCVYLNDADGSFSDISSLTGLDLPDDGRAAAHVDWDLDGRLDLVLTSRSGPRVRVLRNGFATQNGWLQVGLVAAAATGMPSVRESSCTSRTARARVSGRDVLGELIQQGK